MCIYNFFSSHFAVAFHAKLISTFFFPRAFGDNKFHGSLRGQKTFIELTGGRQIERKNRNECRRVGEGPSRCGNILWALERKRKSILVGKNE